MVTSSGALAVVGLDAVMESLETAITNVDGLACGTRRAGLLRESTGASALEARIGITSDSPTLYASTPRLSVTRARDSRLFRASTRRERRVRRREVDVDRRRMGVVSGRKSTRGRPTLQKRGDADSNGAHTTTRGESQVARSRTDRQRFRRCANEPTQPQRANRTTRPAARREHENRFASRYER